MLTRTLRRVGSDYLMPSRLSEYDNLIALILNQGYEIVSLIEYYERLAKGNIGSDNKILINRHDIDTDVKTPCFFEIEKKHGVTASYYFRLKTINISLMQEIQDYGSEASYHFEELASYAKRNKLKKVFELESEIDEIRFEFKKNFLSLENKLGYKLCSVASHGDFANRLLKMTNHPITDSKELRHELGIEVEAYDDKLFSSFDIYLSDRVPPVCFVPMTPIAAIQKGHKLICMLTHPRQWYASWLDNTNENMTRLIEGWRW